ncbi:MAG: 50S ribosomal protein L10 [Verrucomicrobiota bacterium]
MKEESKLFVEEIQSWLKKSPYLMVVDYTGLKVDEFSELRNRLGKANAEMHVVKNTFLRRALADEKLPEINNDLQGQNAVVYGSSDVCAAAKVLKNFASEFQRPKIRVGIIDKAVMDQKSLLKLADLPSREALLSQLLGLINSPATKLARLIQTPASQLAQVIKANSEKGK